jgi:hypothetical protein
MYTCFFEDIKFADKGSRERSLFNIRREDVITFTETDESQVKQTGSYYFAYFRRLSGNEAD